MHYLSPSRVSKDTAEVHYKSNAGEEGEDPNVKYPVHAPFQPGVHLRGSAADPPHRGLVAESGCARTAMNTTEQ